MSTRICRVCSTEKTLEEFHRVGAKNPSPRAECKVCRRAYVRRRRADNRESYLAQQRRWRRGLRVRLDEMKLAAGCADCGYREHPAALDFDHLPGHEKLAGVGRLYSSAKWETVLAEVAKCEVVCANCHRIRTVSRGAE